MTTFRPFLPSTSYPIHGGLRVVEFSRDGRRAQVWDRRSGLIRPATAGERRAARRS